MPECDVIKDFFIELAFKKYFCAFKAILPKMCCYINYCTFLYNSILETFFLLIIMTIRNIP